MKKLLALALIVLVGPLYAQVFPYTAAASGGGAPGEQGPPGPPGADGAVGPQGPTGPQGPSGADGAAGVQGPSGPQGIQGPAGPSGSPGAKGDTGNTGPQGPAGAASTVPGPQGPQGIQGPTGPAGADSTVAGPQGIQGPQGNAGAQGNQGIQGPTGSTGPTGPSGSDQWTYVRLASPVTTSSATAVSITGLAFTPTANKTYRIEAHVLVRAATATVGPRPGLNFPTGLTTQAMVITVPNSATALGFLAIGASTAGQFVAGTGLPVTTADFLGKIEGTIVVGASPSGTVQVTIASETAATNVTVQAGSWLAYREIP